MKLYPLLALALAASPAHAEKLNIDQRIYPRLNAAMNDNRPGSVYFKDASPKYILDRILIQGKSATNWREALEIIVMRRDQKLLDVAAWYDPYVAKEQAACQSEWSEIGRDASSVTFTQHAADCPKGSGELTGIYRMVMSNSTIYILKGLYRGVPDAVSRQQWLDLLASAHVEP